jgi:hypothetical protein
LRRGRRLSQGERSTSSKDHSCQVHSNLCGRVAKEETRLRLISKLRGLYRKGVPSFAPCHLVPL